MTIRTPTDLALEELAYRELEKRHRHHDRIQALSYASALAIPTVAGGVGGFLLNGPDGAREGALQMTVGVAPWMLFYRAFVNKEATEPSAERAQKLAKDIKTSRTHGLGIVSLGAGGTGAVNAAIWAGLSFVPEVVTGIPISQGTATLAGFMFGTAGVAYTQANKLRKLRAAEQFAKDLDFPNVQLSQEETWLLENYWPTVYSAEWQDIAQKRSQVHNLARQFNERDVPLRQRWRRQKGYDLHIAEKLTGAIESFNDALESYRSDGRATPVPASLYLPFDKWRINCLGDPAYGRDLPDLDPSDIQNLYGLKQQEISHHQEERRCDFTGKDLSSGKVNEEFHWFRDPTFMGLAGYVRSVLNEEDPLKMAKGYLLVQNTSISKINSAIDDVGRALLAKELGREEVTPGQIPHLMQDSLQTLYDNCSGNNATKE